MSFRYSVIIPVYNAEKTISRCVESIVSQCCDSCEIILINDGSIDESLKICESYSKNFDYIKVVNKPNGGPSSARNKGLDIASGEYILFVDSDDYVLNNFFSVLDENLDSDFSVFSSNYKKNSEIINQRLSNDLINTENNFCKILAMVKTRYNSPCGKLYKREIIQKNNTRFNEDLNVGEDFLFNLQYALNANSINAVNKSIYCVDVSNEDSITRGFRDDYLEKSLLIYKCGFDIINKADINIEEKEKLSIILDYNFCRTMFACAKITINNKDKIENYKKKFIRVVNDYNANLINIKPNGLIHRVMRFIIKNKLYGVVFLFTNIINGVFFIHKQVS